MSNVIELPMVELQRLIASAVETEKIQPLLDAIILACQERTNLAPIAQAWAATGNKLEPVSFSLFALFLQEFEFELPKSEVKQPTDDAEVSERLKAYQAEADEIIRQAKVLGASAEFQSLQRKLRADYGTFTPAHQLAHILPTYFEDEDPGKVIGQYMDLLFSESGNTTRPDFSRYKVTNRSLAEMVLEIGRACLNADKSYTVNAVNLLDRALNYIVLAREDMTGFNCSKDCGPFFSTIEVAPISLVMKLLWQWGDENHDQYDPESLPAFSALLNIIGMVEPAAGQTGRKLPLAAFDLIHARITIAFDGGASADDDFLTAVLDLLDRSRNFARRKLGGRSPFTEETAHWCSFWNQSSIVWEPYDLRFELANATNVETPSKLHVFDLGGTDKSPIDLLSRSDAYLALFDACVEEGFPHLASAVLAFYIFSQAVAHKGRLGPWLEIAKRVEQAAPYPGQKMVSQALRVAAALAREVSPLTTLAIESWFTEKQERPASNVVEISTARTAGLSSRAEIEDDWKKRLGPLRWEKLSKKCQGFLVNGDWLWGRYSVEFCKSDVNLGSNALDYAKAIEAELVKRLEQYYASRLFLEHCKSIDFVPPKEPTLVQILRTLKDRHPLPDVLRVEIETAGVRCQNDRVLMKQLRNLGDLRNAAAHTTSEFGPMQYTEMKDLINKLMPAFADSLD